MMTKYEKSEKFKEIRRLISEIETDERSRYPEQRGEIYDSASILIRLDDASNLISKAERIAKIRDGVIEP